MKNNNGPYQDTSVSSPNLGGKVDFKEEGKLPDTPPRKQNYQQLSQFRSIPTRKSDSKLLFQSADRKEKQRYDRDYH